MKPLIFPDFETRRMNSVFILTMAYFLPWIAFSAEYHSDGTSRLSTLYRADGTVVRYTHSKSGNRLSRRVESPYRNIRLEVVGAPGTANGGGIVPVGSTLTLAATPSATSDFADWQYMNTIVGTSEILEYTVPADAPAFTVISARFTPGVPASISASSSSQTVDSGTAVTFTPIAEGSGTLSYQWYRNGVAIPGATSLTLDLPAASFTDAGQYILRVSNRHGAAESHPSLLSVRMSGYAQWKNSVFSPVELSANDPNVVGENAILDGHKPNLLHYAFGVGPYKQIPAQEIARSAQGGVREEYITLRYRHLIGGGGLRYRVGVSDDLLTWDESESDIERVGTPTPNNDGITETTTVRLRTPIGVAGAKKFLRLSVTNGGTGSPIIFSDSFDDNTFDFERWTRFGNAVEEIDGMMKITAATTDRYGQGSFYPIGINNTGLVTITRKVWLHASNNYSLPSVAMRFGDLPGCQVTYGKMVYGGSPQRPVHGIVISRNGTSPHSAGTEADCSATTPVPWDTWFNEKITYQPATGEMRYFINGEEKIVFNVGIMPASAVPALGITFNAAAWHTGHQHFFDDLVVTQEPGTTLPTSSYVLRLSPSLNHDFFITNFYAYDTGLNGEGGAKKDHRLRVGGVGDTYASLLKFHAPDLPPVAASAKIVLMPMDEGNRTNVKLRRVTTPWDWNPQFRWAQRPGMVDLGTLPAPYPGVPYSIDITSLYNQWRSGTFPDHGIALFPEGTSNQFSTFLTSRVTNPFTRPVLIVVPQAQ